MQVDLPPVPSEQIPTNPQQHELSNSLSDNNYDPVVGGIEPVKSPKVTERKINVEAIKDANVSETVKMNFFDDSSVADDFVTAPTNPSKVNQTGQPIADPQAKPFINAPNNQSSASSYSGTNVIQSKAELKSTVKVIIAAFDILASNGLRLLAKDASNAPYSASAMQKDLLETALVELMFEKQAKLSPVWLLSIAIVGAYAFPVQEALKNRASNMSAKKRNMPHTQPAPQVSQQQSSQSKPIVTPYAPLPSDKPSTTKPITQPMSQELSLIPTQNGEVHFPSTEYTWKNPDPNIIANDKHELIRLNNQGIWPKYIRNKVNKKVKEVPYKENGVVKLDGRTPKFGS